MVEGHVPTITCVSYGRYISFPYRDAHANGHGQQYGEELYVDVPRTSAEEYRSHCHHMSCMPQDPVYTQPAYPSITGSANSGGSYHQPMNYTGSSNPPGSLSYPGNAQTIHVSGLPGSTYKYTGVSNNQQVCVVKELYWCVNKSWGNADMMVSPIKLDDAYDDNALFTHLNRIYMQVHGRWRRFLHWKSCEDIAFIEVS
jgi:hypothetical protein